MSEVVQIAPGEILPDAEGVLRALGRPPGAAPDERLARLLAEASALFAELAHPAGLSREVTRQEFAEVYRGEGENEPRRRWRGSTRARSGSRSSRRPWAGR